MRPSSMPWPNAVISEPAQKAKIQRGLDSLRARMRNSKDTLRSTTPSTMKVSGPYNLPSTAPQANGKAEANRPMPSSSQNSLASRQGLNRLIMRPRSCSGASCNRMPTPRSKPSSTTPAAMTTNSRPMNASGIQKDGSSGLRPCEAASMAIMMRLRQVCAPAPRHTGPRGTACRQTPPAAARRAGHSRSGHTARCWPTWCPIPRSG
jgi:hypothetical protein